MTEDDIMRAIYALFQLLPSAQREVMLSRLGGQSTRYRGSAIMIAREASARKASWTTGEMVAHFRGQLTPRQVQNAVHYLHHRGRIQKVSHNLYR